MTPIRTLLVPNHDHPYATVNAVFLSAGLHDPLGKEGLAYLAVNMLMRGTAKRSQAELAEEIDILGSTLDVYVGKESAIFRGDALKRNLDRLLALLAEVLTSPTFLQDELDKLRRQTEAELSDLRNHDEALARLFFYQYLYDGHAFGRPGKGTVASLRRITREDVVAFYEQHVRRGNLVLACAGDFSEAELATALSDHFAGLRDGAVPEEPVEAEPPVRGRSLLLVDKPDRTQTQVLLGHLSVNANDPDYYPLLLANVIFGGTFTARLSREIREKRGWSYGAYSYFSPARRTGSFSVRFYPDAKNTANALRLALELTEQLATDGVTEAELAFAKGYLVKRFPFQIDTPPKRLEQLISGLLLGWSPDFLDRYVADVEAPTLEQVNAALKRHVRPEDLVITVVCSAAALRDELSQLPGVRQTIVHPYDRDWDPPPDGIARR